MAKVVKSDEPFLERAEAKKLQNDQIRETMSKIVRIVFLFFALALALAAFLVAANENVSPDNPLVKLILNVAEAIDGPFSRDNGIFAFNGGNADTKNAVVNWGIAALVYLAIGRYFQRVLAPKK